MDASNVVAWSVAVFGVVICWALGHRRGRRKGPLGTFTALGLAMAVGFGLTFVAAASLDFCIELTYCRYKGEGNVRYWFHSLFAIPVYWFTLALASRAANQVIREK